MTKMMDEGWTLVRAEERFLDNPSLAHVHDLVMIKDGKYKYIEVKNWNQSDDGPSLAVYLWSSMKGAAEAKDGKAGQLFIDLKRAFSKDSTDLDVLWLFGNRSGDTSKIAADLVEHVKANPERFLAILKDANNVPLFNELEGLIKTRSKADIDEFVMAEFAPIIKEIFKPGATLAKALEDVK